MNTYILPFKNIKKEDISTVGGKAANLGEMTAIGLNVPSGVTLSVDAYTEYLNYNAIEIEDVFRKSDSDDKALEHIQYAIEKGEFPKNVEDELRGFYNALLPNTRLAVRSSATAEDLDDASFAGQQETYLNVSSYDELLSRVKDCYKSLWAKRAHSYRRESGYASYDVSLAVVIQEMVESDCSGVLFTNNPTTKSDDMLINASYGLGEAVVSGIVSPDEYIVSRNFEIKNVIIGSKEVEIVYGEKGTKKLAVDDDRRKKQAIEKETIEKLVREALKIEAHYQSPMDIEWAVKNNIIYILQARKITTDNGIDEVFTDKDFAHLPVVKPVKKSLRETVLFNLEKLPRPFYPLDFDFANILGVEKQRLFSEMGLSMNDMNTMDEDGISGFDLSGIRPNLNIFCIIKTMREMKNHKENIKLSSDLLAECSKRLDNEMMVSITSALDIREALIRMKKLISDTAYSRFKYAVFPLVIENKILERTLKKLDESYSAFDLLDGLSYVTTDINRDMKKIAKEIIKRPELVKGVEEKSYDELCNEYAEIKLLFGEFMSKYGNKSDFNCYCFDAKSWLDEPDRFLNTLRVQIKSLENSDGAKVETDKYTEILQNLKGKLSEKKYLKFKSKSEAVRHYYYIREASQYLWESEFRYCRYLLKRAGQLLGVDYDSLVYLFDEELFDVLEKGNISQKYQDIIARRKSKRPLALAYRERSLEVLLSTKESGVNGITGSSGRARGKVKIINSQAEFNKLEKDDVLVCPYTDPEWTVLFSLASAVVVDTGGSLSHAAIVAREYGIPAVLATGNATKVLHDGDIVVVDGSNGTVNIIESKYDDFDDNSNETFSSNSMTKIEKGYEKLPKPRRISNLFRESLSFKLEKIPTPFYPLDYDFSYAIFLQKQKLFKDLGLNVYDLKLLNKDGVIGIDSRMITPNINIFKVFQSIRGLRNKEENTKLAGIYLEECEKRLEIEIDKSPSTAKDIGICLEKMKKLIEDTGYYRFRYSVFPQVFENRLIEKMLKKVNPDYSAFDVLDGLHYVTTDINREMEDIAEFIIGDGDLLKVVMTSTYRELVENYPTLRKRFSAFMENYGSRLDSNCYCFQSTSWMDEPERFLGTLRVIIHSLQHKNSYSSLGGNKFEVLMEDVKESVSEKKYNKFAKTVAAIRKYHVVRESSRYLIEKEFAYCRELLQKAAVLLKADYRDFTYLFSEELFDVLKSAKLDEKYQEIIQRRKQARPLVEYYWDRSVEVSLSTKEDYIKGISGSVGTVKGKVRLIHNVREFYKLKKGEVLVCPYTDPEWTVLFSLASAVVVDTGGSLSHAAIVAREYGLPAVLATGNATKVLKDGDLVLVDGAKGVVKKLE